MKASKCYVYEKYSGLKRDIESWLNDETTPGMAPIDHIRDNVVCMLKSLLAEFGA
jgi:hypothetical protein